MLLDVVGQEGLREIGRVAPQLAPGERQHERAGGVEDLPRVGRQSAVVARIWSELRYKTGTSPASYDKQFVRDYLERIGWNKQPPVPELPADVVEGTARRYQEYYEKLLAA